MKTIITIYLTALHLFAFSLCYLYTGDTWTLARIQHQEADAGCCRADELTAYLDKQMAHRKGK